MGADVKLDEMLAREKEKWGRLERERGRGGQSGQSGGMRVRGESREGVKTNHPVMLKSGRKVEEQSQRGQVTNTQQKARRLQGVSICSINFNGLLQRSYSL